MVKNKQTNDTDVEEGGWGWFLVLGLFIGMFIMKGSQVSLGIFFIAFVNYFGEGAGKTSWILSLVSCMTWFMAPLSTALAKKYGHRKIITIGSVLSTLSVFVSTFSNDVWVLALTLGFLNGAGFGLVSAPLTSSLQFYFKKRQSLALGIAYTGIGVGSLSFPPLLNYWLDLYGWRGSLLLFSAMTAHLCISATLVQKPSARCNRKPTETPSQTRVVSNDDVKDMQKNNTTTVDCKEHSGSHDSITPTNQSKQTCSKVCAFFKDIGTFFDLTLLCDASFVIFLLTYALFSMGQNIITMHLAPRIQDIGISKETTALILSLYGVGIFVGAPVLGAIASYVKLVRRNIYYYFSGILFGTGLTVLLFTLSSNPYFIATFVIVQGFARGGYSAQTIVLVRNIVGDENAITGYGWTLLFASIGQLIGAPISGYLRDYTGRYTASFYLGGACFIASGLSLLLLFAIRTSGCTSKGCCVKADAHQHAECTELKNI